jgi:hypothetical protein
MIGEAERVALATANSELRSIIREAKRLVDVCAPYGMLAAHLAADT